MSYGMTPDEFWNGHCKLAVSYREKSRLEREKVNEQLWLQGMYIYDAVGRLFSKHPKKYPERPYELSNGYKSSKEYKEAAGIKFMEEYAAKFNVFFKKSQEAKEAPEG